MKNILFYAAGNSPALDYAVKLLTQKGCAITDSPDSAVTHLLLPVPSFEKPGIIRGNLSVGNVLNTLPKTVTILGGNLSDSELSNYKTTDLLQDEMYLAENAAITAHCAVKLALQKLPTTTQGLHVLVIGWGRIGKTLAALLKSMGANVTVAARKESDRAILYALGYGAADPAKLSYDLARYRIIFNTAPVPILSGEQIVHARSECLKIDLASKPGIAGNDIIWARGLPGKAAPETSGELIARTVIRLAQHKE